MANRTEKTAKTVKGTNPQFLIEKIIRQRIYDSMYWKEHCFALTADLVVDKGMELRYIGGIYAGNIKPTPFLCLSLKLLQIQPDKEIIMEFIQQEDFKYIRALGAMYLRLSFDSIEIYKYLEPLYNDFRKLRYMNKMGRFELIHMDEFIDHLLRDDHYCDIQLPRLQKRIALEEVNLLNPYKSLLDDDLLGLSGSESEEEDTKKEKPRLTSKRRDRSRDRERDVGDRRAEYEREKNRERKDRGEDVRSHRDRGDRSDRDRRRDRSRERDRGRERDRRDDRDDRDRKDRDRKKEKSKDDKKKSNSNNDEEREIAEQNALRASLGLAPLER